MKLKPPYLLGLRVLASLQNGHFCEEQDVVVLSDQVKGATLDMAGAALDSFEAASPWDFFFGNIPLALQAQILHLLRAPGTNLLRAFAAAGQTARKAASSTWRAGHNINLSLALLQKGLVASWNAKLGTHSMKKTVVTLMGQGAAVSWSMKGTIYQSFSIVHSQVLYMVQKPCVRGMYRGEPGRNETRSVVIVPSGVYSTFCLPSGYPRVSYPRVA